MEGLKELRVMDHSTENAGTYYSKLFTDAGIDALASEKVIGDRPEGV